MRGQPPIVLEPPGSLRQRQTERRSATADGLDLFGTKAETLAALQSRVRTAPVPELLYFSSQEWQEDACRVTDSIVRRFGGGSIVVRSSAIGEDRDDRSRAGEYASCLNVDGADRDAIDHAVRTVLDSYDGDPRDQVLVMPMLEDVVLSGVVMTHELDTGAPYYVLNYDDETGKTDTITGGRGVSKTVLVHRDFATGHVESQRVGELLEMARELEVICGRDTPLDIEFAKTADGRLHLLQVRRIAMRKNWNRRIRRAVGEVLYQAERFFAMHTRPSPELAGPRTILGQMPDWNPAEIIGARPRPLAISLYRYLITDSVWQQARATMGYRGVADTPLMLVLGGQPYVDVRASFNSFLPASVPDQVGDRLVAAWLDRLDEHPELHDKVEFEVAQTVVDFGFASDHEERYPGVLTAAERDGYQDALARLTMRSLGLGAADSLPSALRQVDRLRRAQGPVAGGGPEDLRILPAMLRECRDDGTLPFAIIARHAFLAEALLRSAVSTGVLSETRLGELKSSLPTITTELACDFDRALAVPAARSEFFARYGHLRPGTYDIASPRYDQRKDLFDAASHRRPWKDDGGFALSSTESRAFVRQARAVGLEGFDPEHFMEYARRAIAGREWAKFVFTRHLSDALERIACWGRGYGLDREALSYLSVEDLLGELVHPILNDPELHYRDLSERRRREREAVAGVRLGYLIRDTRDLYVVPVHRSSPNFVTQGRVEAAPLRLDGRTQSCELSPGRIVCIENADPGYDWIFTRDIAGLVSKYGGANSHMTIRCAELGLPAAIGVGEHTFARIVEAHRVELDAAERIIRPVHG